MYQQHWGLNGCPFTAIGTGKSFFKSEAQEEAIARIQYLIENNRRVGLLVGQDGFGKTAVLEYIASQTRRRGFPTAVVNVLGMDEQEFVMNLAHSLGASFSLSAPPVVAWREIFDSFVTSQYQRLNTVILLDDVHEADSSVLTSIVRLSQWQPASATRLTIVMAAETERAQLIGRRLIDLCELRIELAAWELNDTVSYLRTAMLSAGAERPVFDVKAIESLHNLTAGNPRRIRQIANLALVAGAGQELERIDADTVVAVDEELRVAQVV